MLFQFRKQFLYLRIDREPEIAVASKHIFKEAGLALVNTHGTAVVGLCVLQRGIDILLKDAMSALVDGREHGTEVGSSGTVMVRDADIVFWKIRVVNGCSLYRQRYRASREKPM